MSAEVGRCEAQWVVEGIERACGESATRVVFFEGEQLLVCDRCSADLFDFELYRVARELQGPREALESWTGKPE